MEVVGSVGSDVGLREGAVGKKLCSVALRSVQVDEEIRNLLKMV